MNKKYLIVLLILLATLLSAISFFLFASPFISLQMGNLSNDISGFKLAFDFEGEYVNFEHNPWAMLIFASLLLTFVCFAKNILLSVFSIMFLSGKQLPKIKNAKDFTEEEQKKQRLIPSVLSPVVALIVLIININIVGICGYEDNPLAHVGTGAIVSGVLLLAADIISVYSDYCTGYRPLYVALCEEEIIKKTSEVTITQQLQELNSLKEQGLISEADYEAKKKQILGL